MGNMKHGMAGTKLYRAWANMKKRCNKPTGHDGENYKNISYIPEWKEFQEFMTWAIENGYKEHLTLERKDVYGNYEPSNCTWITMRRQQRNKTNTRWITFKGKTQSLVDWAEELGIERDTLKSRILRGWSVERAFNEELGVGRKEALNKRNRDEKGRLL